MHGAKSGPTSDSVTAVGESLSTVEAVENMAASLASRFFLSIVCFDDEGRVLLRMRLLMLNEIEWLCPSL